MSAFFVSSIFGLLTKKPIVQVEVRHEGQQLTIQMSPADARSVALNLLESAEAADMDAIVIKFLTEKLGQSFEASAAILNDFRKLRDELEEKK